MKLDTKKTLTINTESFHGGVLIFSGYVEVQSLKDYMMKSMKGDQWRHVGEASYNNVLLAFTKPNKTAIIVLAGGGIGKFGKTKMEMYVTVDAAASKQLNPFGEPVTTDQNVTQAFSGVRFRTTGSPAKVFYFPFQEI